MKQLSHSEIGSLRDINSELLGKRVVLEGINLAETHTAEQIALTTRGQSILVVSQVELYPYLQPETGYRKRFDDADRTAGQAFVFPVQGGAPAVSVVLPEQDNAIAVIKQLMAHDGEDLSWAAALERLGVDRSQFKELIEIMDGIDMTRRNAQLRLQPIPDLQVEYDLKEKPRADVPNLDSTLRLNRGTRAHLRELLPQILAEETAR